MESEKTSDRKNTKLSSDFAIITTTAREVSLMSFSPPISYSKKLALDSLFYFGSVKIFLKFSRPFWSEPNRLPIILFNSSTEQNGASAVSDDIIRTVCSV